MTPFLSDFDYLNIIIWFLDTYLVGAIAASVDLIVLDQNNFIVQYLNSELKLTSTTGSKQNIDDDTPIELSCDTPNTTIFYTINGEKPVPFDTKSRWTYTYTGMIVSHIILSPFEYLALRIFV